MPKINLDQQYLWAGTYYGPGETEVPDSFTSAYNLTPKETKDTNSPPDQKTTQGSKSK